MSGKIQNLLEQANHSEAEDSSVNLAKRDFLSEAEAKDFFRRVKQNLLDIDQWNKNSTPSNYQLFYENGEVSMTKIIDAGKFIRIGVPATGKFDWVRVIGIYETASEFVITVQPTFDPTKQPVDETVTSHFFKAEARNNFCLQQDDQAVTLYVIGLDEKANVKESGNPIEAARNAATANFGYYLGIQKAMWTEFCKNFMEIGEEEK
jgi:hypothetical protein